MRRWVTFSWMRRWVTFSLCNLIVRFLWCFLFFIQLYVTCLCTLVISWCRFVASAWSYRTCIDLTCIKLLLLFICIWKWYVVFTFILFTSIWNKIIIFTFYFEDFPLFLPLWVLFGSRRVITWAVDTFGPFFTHAMLSKMFRYTTVEAYSMTTTLVILVTKHLAIVTSKWVWYIDIYFYLYKAYFNNCR